MRAAIQKVYGGPDVLAVGEVADPALGARDVLVEIHASPVTYGDRRLRAADFPPLFAPIAPLFLGWSGPRRPPGSMFAGRVVAVGAQVTGFRVGEDVFGASLSGAYAERLAVPESGVIARMPAGITHAEAAALPYGACTALYFLRELGKVRPGQRLLVVGAAGGVGDFAVQIGKALGAHVTAVCARRSFDRMGQIGADRCVDYTTEDFAASGERWDVIFDTIGAAPYGRVRRVLSRGGTLLSLEMSLGVLLWSLVAPAFGRRAKTGGTMGDPALLRAVADLVTRGALRPHLRAVYPLDEVARAHADAERRGVDGVVLVTPR